MDDVKVISWFVQITWSYDVELLGLTDGATRYHAENLGWLTITSAEDIAIGLIVDAEVPGLAELLAIDKVNQWLLAEDLPGITTYETEVTSLAAEMIELEAWSIVTKVQDRIFLGEGLI